MSAFQRLRHLCKGGIGASRLPTLRSPTVTHRSTRYTDLKGRPAAAEGVDPVGRGAIQRFRGGYSNSLC
jgi:hypothetical protein